jgi:hypothetical protein
VKAEDCGHEPPFVHQIDFGDLQTREVKRRVSYCTDCAALVKDHRAGVAFDKARKAIPHTLEDMPR